MQKWLPSRPKPISGECSPRFYSPNLTYKTERILEEDGTSVAPPQRTQSSPAAPPKPMVTSTRQRIENRAELEKNNETDSSTSDNDTNKDDNEATKDVDMDKNSNDHREEEKQINKNEEDSNKEIGKGGTDDEEGCSDDDDEEGSS